MKKTVNRLFLALVALALLLGGGLTLLRERSAPATALFWEQRAPEPAPALSKSALWSGEYFTGLDAFLSDRFPGRDVLIRLDTRLDLALKRPVVHGVALGDGAIFPFHGFSTWDVSYLADNAQTMAQGLAALRDQAAAYGGRLYYVGVPQQYSYFHAKYPSYLDDRQWLLSQSHDAFAQALAGQAIPFVDMAARFDALGHPDEYYSPTDHHYTYLGALETYAALMETVNADTGWDLPVTTPDDLDLTALPNPFLGSQNRKVYGLYPTDEKLLVGQLRDPIPFTRTDNGQPVDPTLYDLPSDGESQVAYTLYMGGDVAETVIETHRPGLPKCLIWGDSFTNALETVLWTSFDETRSLDLRHYTAKTLSEYIADYRPDVIICLRDDTAYTDLTGNGAFAAQTSEP